MSGLAFFDTNILVYSDDARSPEKQSRAIQLLKDHRKQEKDVISLQVLQEYYATVTRKFGFDPELAQQKVELLARGRVIRFEAREAGKQFHSAFIHNSECRSVQYKPRCLGGPHPGQFRHVHP